MTDRLDAQYRLRLAEGFLREAEQDFGSQRWRSCVDNAQLSIENSGKTILAIFGPAPRTHQPTRELQDLVEKGKLDPSLVNRLSQVLPLFDEFGLEEHFKTDYGLESDYLLPWELYDEEDARKAKRAASQCLELAREVFEFYFPNPQP